MSHDSLIGMSNLVKSQVIMSQNKQTYLEPRLPFPDHLSNNNHPSLCWLQHGGCMGLHPDGRLDLFWEESNAGSVWQRAAVTDGQIPNGKAPSSSSSSSLLPDHFHHCCSRPVAIARRSLFSLSLFLKTSY